MPFNLLLANHLHHGTSFNESGVSVSIKPGRDETFLFFHLDSDENRQQFNQYLGIANTGEPICDLLIYYFKHTHNEPEKAICLVELKGRDVSHGVKQLLNTYNIFNTKLAGARLFQNVKWGAVIINHSKSPTPKNTKRLLTPLGDKGLKCGIMRKGLETFIRSLK
ncbi:MAG: hypothetical protein EF813_07045 [Methanosarcinales archaeon]|nr:MAG: hypothetical protein EF813_07045 [Methanosarcinales archaeon]